MSPLVLSGHQTDGCTAWLQVHSVPDAVYTPHAQITTPSGCQQPLPQALPSYAAAYCSMLLLGSAGLHCSRVPECAVCCAVLTCRATCPALPCQQAPGWTSRQLLLTLGRSQRPANCAPTAGIQSHAQTAHPSHRALQLGSGRSVQTCLPV
jgi:hypothetical protein